MISDVQTYEKVFLLEVMKCHKWTNKQNKEGQKENKAGQAGEQLGGGRQRALSEDKIWEESEKQGDMGEGR